MREMNTCVYLNSFQIICFYFFFVFVFFFKYYFYHPLLHVKAKWRESHFYQQACMFPVLQLSFFVSTEAVSSLCWFFALVGICILCLWYTYNRSNNDLNPQFLPLRENTSMLSMKKDTIPAIFVLLCKMKFSCLYYCRVSSNIAEIMANFTNFCHF